jgi:hypothetical protein
MKYAIANVTIGSSTSTAALMYAPRRTQSQLTCSVQAQSRHGGRGPPPGPPNPPGRPGRRGGGGGPPGGPPPRLARPCRPEVGPRLSIAALTWSSASRRNGVDGGPANAALTSSMGSPRRGARSPLTGGRIVVIRSSGGAWRRRLIVGGASRRSGPRGSPPGRLGFGRSFGFLLPTRSVPGPRGSPDEGVWRPSLLNGRAGVVGRRPCASGASGRRGRARRAEHI